MIPVTFQGTERGQAVVRYASGTLGRARMPRSGSLPKPGAAALVSLRPERIRLLSTGVPAEQITDSTLISHTFLGRHARSVVAAIGQILAVSTTDAPAAIPVEGSPVRLGWNYDDAHMLAGGISTDNKGGTHG